MSRNAIFYKNIDYSRGGSGGGNLQINITDIFIGTGASVNNTTYTMLDSIDNYDFIGVYNGVWSEWSRSSDTYAEIAWIPVADLNDMYANNHSYARTSWGQRHLHVFFHENQFQVVGRDSLDVCMIV